MVKQIKMRKDSINEFAKAGREDLVNQYQSEVDILTSYICLCHIQNP